MKRWGLFLIVVMILSIVPGWAINSVTAQVELTEKLYPTDDAYVKDTSPDANYGDYGTLYVGTYYKDNSNERAYLKFDLSSLPENAMIVSAKLYAYTYSGAYSVPVNISVYGVSDDSWSEDSITWNNKPEAEQLLDKNFVGTAGDQWSVWDVTEFVQTEFNRDKVVSFVLISDSEGEITESIGYNSKESTYGNYPYLEITYRVEANVSEVSIQEIQSNTTDGDKSAYDGKVVKTYGVVTGVGYRGFFIQNGTGPWSGIFVFTDGSPPQYNDGSPVKIGDVVEVEGTVKEYYNKGYPGSLTEISHVSSIVKVGTAPVPAPVVLPTGNVSQEQWESVLVEVRNVMIINTTLGYGEWLVDDGTGSVRIDDYMYPYDEYSDELREGKWLAFIRGVVYYSHNAFKIEPRNRDDIGFEFIEQFIEKFYPAEDAYGYYYKGEEISWKNYHYYSEGDKYELAVGNSSTYQSERAYLKFNLTLPEDAVVSSAKLCVYVAYIKNGPLNVGLYKTTSNWSEKEKPETFPEQLELIDNITISSTGYSCWHLGNISSGIVSYLLKLVNESEYSYNYMWILSKENPDNKPYIEVVYTRGATVEEIGNTTLYFYGKEKPNYNVSNGFAVFNISGISIEVPIENRTALIVNETALKKVLSTDEPAIVAGWNSGILNISTDISVSKTELPRKTITKTYTTMRLNVSVGWQGFAVIAIPMKGKPEEVTVTKNNQTFTLTKEKSEIGYYYESNNLLFVVLNGDPVVIIKFVSEEVSEHPSIFDIMTAMSWYYVPIVHKQASLVDQKYSELVKYLEIIDGKANITSIKPLIDDINEHYNQYLQLKRELPKSMTNVSVNMVPKVFLNARKSFLLQRYLLEKFEFILPLLNTTAKQVLIQNVTNITVELPKVYKVLIDSGHNQYYNANRMSGLINRIKSELNWTVDVNYGMLTYEKLKNYDILIITNPQSDITDEEAQAIKQWVKEGGGLFILGDWYRYVYYRSLNKITEEFGIKFNDDELMDDEINDGKPYYPFVGEYNFEHPAMKFLNETWKMYYNGDTLDVSGDAVWLIRGYESSYAVDQTGKITKEKGSKPIVAAAVEVGEGRIVAYGSSKAISDKYYGNYITTNWPFIKGVLLWLAGEI